MKKKKEILIKYCKPNSTYKLSPSGFTLIEILVVISIIGILTSLLVANFAQVRSRARDAQRKSDLTQIKKAIQMYYNDNNATYPTSIPFEAAFTSANTAAPYMGYVPQDPLSPDQVYSYSTSGADSFELWATLENPSDKNSVPSQTRCGLTPTPGVYVVCPY